MLQFLRSVSLKILRQVVDLDLSQCGNLQFTMHMSRKHSGAETKKDGDKLKHALQIFLCIKKNKIRRVEGPTFSLLASVLM